MGLWEKNQHFVGDKVIVRSPDSGDHFGTLLNSNLESRCVLLTNARRLYKWRAFTLTEVANKGMHDDKALLSEIVNNIIIGNVCEIIPCSPAAIENIENYPIYDPWDEGNDQ